MSGSASYQNLRRLAYFATIADVGSIRGAAKRLGLSVPVVSTALAELEAELNVVLAIRSTRRLTLTPAGQDIHRLASTMLGAADQALTYGKDHRPLVGTLALTLPVELASNWLPQRLVEFQAQHPDISLYIDANDKRIELRNSPFDVAIRATYQPPWQKNDVPLHREQGIDLICVARSQPDVVWDGNTGRIDTVLLTRLEKNPGLNALDLTTAQQVRLIPNKSITVNNKETAMAMARQGLGCALIAADAVKGDANLQPLVPIFAELDFGWLAIEIVLRDHLPSPATRAFVQFLDDYNSLENP
ncbi:MAG: LysR family transcriptional regulator [Cyanobacteria bacterium P01_F01_bin.150]